MHHTGKRKPSRPVATSGLSDEGTNRKERDTNREKKKHGGVLRRLGFVLSNDKSEQGSTLKKKKRKNTKASARPRRSITTIRDTKVHFIFQKPHSQIPLKGEKMTDLQKSVFHKFALENVKRGPYELSMDFMSKVKPYIGQPLKREVFDANPTKNRYKDVVCNDITRVAINDGRDDTLGDYIHANWVNGLTAPFILTQGPLERTVIDFWRMLVHTKCAYVVMLCEVTEEGKPKCFQYWPDKPGHSMTFGDFTITCKNEEDKDEHVIKSLLTIKSKGGEHEHVMRHLHTKSWPDKFVPNSSLSLLRMLYIVRSSTGPVCVHCSAGIGRTGTFVAIEVCLQTLTDEKELDIISAIKALRNSRLGSVQVDVQYMILVQLLLNYGKDNGYWDDSDLDDRIELLTWNISQFVQTRTPVKPPAAEPCQKDKEKEKEKEKEREKEKDKEREKEKERDREKDKEKEKEKEKEKDGIKEKKNNSKDESDDDDNQNKEDHNNNNHKEHKEHKHADEKEKKEDAKEGVHGSDKHGSAQTTKDQLMTTTMSKDALVLSPVRLANVPNGGERPSLPTSALPQCHLTTCHSTTTVPTTMAPASTMTAPTVKPSTITTTTTTTAIANATTNNTNTKRYQVKNNEEAGEKEGRLYKDKNVRPIEQSQYLG